MDGTRPKPGIPKAKPQRRTAFGTLNGQEAFAWVFPCDMPKDLTEGKEITASEVLGWFRKAAPNWPAPPPNSPLIRPFTVNLNILRLSEPFQVDVTSSEYQRIKRVMDAIRSLHSDLPPIIEGARRSREHARDMGREPLTPNADATFMGLFEAVQEVERVFAWGPPRKRNEAWHDAAMVVAASAREIWRSVGQQKVGMKSTSPLVRLITKALPRVGEGERSADAIAKALQRHWGSRAKSKSITASPNPPADLPGQL